MINSSVLLYSFDSSITEPEKPFVNADCLPEPLEVLRLRFMRDCQPWRFESIFYAPFTRTLTHLCQISCDVNLIFMTQIRPFLSITIYWALFLVYLAS